jgi:hypothetical protein
MKTMTMAHPEWQQFANGLGNAIHARGCDHTHEHTRALLEVLGFADDEIEAFVAGFTEAGGFCDCEILMNLAGPASEPTEPKTPGAPPAPVDGVEDTAKKVKKYRSPAQVFGDEDLRLGMGGKLGL